MSFLATNPAFVSGACWQTAMASRETVCSSTSGDVMNRFLGYQIAISFPYFAIKNFYSKILGKILLLVAN